MDEPQEDDQDQDKALYARIPAIVYLCLAVPALMALMLLGLHERAWVTRWFAAPEVRLAAGPEDRESGLFVPCRWPAHYNCVINGAMIWYRDEKIRIADINTPSLSAPACDDELRLGEKSARRLMALLNQDRFSLVPWENHDGIERDVDEYGRKLRVLKRGGISLGEVLVTEGLAERRTGIRRDWCNDAS